MQSIYFKKNSEKYVLVLFSIILNQFIYISCSVKNDSDEILKVEKEVSIDYILEIPDTNTLGLKTLIPNKVADGYTLFTVSYMTYLINNCGQVINSWTSDYTDGKSVYLLEDGSILRAGLIENEAFTIAGLGGIIQKIDWDGNLLWEYRYSNNIYSQHHDIYPMPNGNVLLLAVEKKTKDEVLKAGRNPIYLVDGELYNEKIIELKPSGRNSATIIWEWNIWDHLVQDFDENALNFGKVSANPQLLDINYLGTSAGKANWLHFNSIQYSPQLDQILISSRQTNEILIIDHSTTTEQARSHTGGKLNMGGDIIYRWGNPEVYQTGNSNDQKLFGQHYPHWIKSDFRFANSILLFNNGVGRKENYSSIEIINPPIVNNGSYSLLSGESYHPVTPSWSYDNKPEFYSKIMSSAQMLQNGNILICDADSGYIFEIDSKNDIVWEYINPHGTNNIIKTQGEVPSSNLTFRAIKYSKSYNAFVGKNLTPQNPIELNFNIGNCQD